MKGLIKHYGTLDSSTTQRFALFDYDHTIVKPKDGRRFPKNIDDWQYLRASVPKMLRKYGKKRHIIIVTDQTKAWKIDQITAVIEDLNLPLVTLLVGSRDDKTTKPSRRLIYRAFPQFRDKDIEIDGFYVGDAGGREGDWSDVDKQYAEKLGLDYHSPEEIFPLDSLPDIKVKPRSTREVVIMVGYPASGKSTIAKSLIDVKASNPYYHIDGDTYKTPARMLKVAASNVESHSIIFDATNGTVERRKLFIEFAKEYDLPVRCFWLKVDIDTAMERNKNRAATGDKKLIPAVVYYTYRKRFETPTNEEGMKVVSIEN